MSTKAAGLSELAHAGIAAKGLSREMAAAYVGVSPVTFDGMVRSGLMPRAKQIGGRLVWDRVRLDRAFEALPDAPGKSATGYCGDGAWDVWDRVAP